MKDYLLCVDNGGTYIKAAIVDRTGAQVGLAKARNVIEHPRPRTAEIDLERFWQVNCELIREVLAQTGVAPEDIACVGFSGQGKGIYLVDAEGKPVYKGLTSSDARALPYVNAWKTDGTDDSVYDLIYQGSSAGKPQSQMRWLKDNEPKAYAAARWLFSMKDYLSFRLTGVPVAGMGAMSSTNLLNLNTWTYDKRLFEAYGIEETFSKMPPLKWDTEIVGTVSAESAAATGLLEGTPVSAGMFDVSASVLAMGVTSEEPLAMITGTHGVNIYLARKPVTNGTIKLNSLYSLEGFYQIEEGYPGSSGALEWVLDQLFDREAEPDLYGTVNEMVASVDPAASKVVFLPFLSGWRDAKPATGCFLGLRPETGKPELLRAVYEGAVFFHCLQIEHLLANRTRPEQILMAGGATNSSVWVQMFADALQMPISVVSGEEMGVKGVAITASVAAGMYESIEDAVAAMVHPGTLVQPNPELAEVYAAKLETFRTLVDTLAPVWELM